MTEQFVEIAGQQVVILSKEEFRRLSEDAENYRDICAAITARERREAGEDYLPADLADRILNGESALKVWRKFRGLTLDQLAERVGRTGSFLAKIEKGQNEGGIKLWRSLAAELNVEIDDIEPVA